MFLLSLTDFINNCIDNNNKELKMYNQFTAIDQKPLPVNRIILNPMEIPKANKRKKKKAHSKNPYKIKKIKLKGQQGMAQKSVDGLMLLKMLHFEHPKQIITANISYKRIVHINPDHLEYFPNLIELDCSQNYIPLEELRKLPAIEKINISHNKIKQIDLESGGFTCLHTLNMSFNQLNHIYIPQLSLIYCLIDLNLSYNELEDLPSQMSNFKLLKKFNLQGNKFKSDPKAAAFWGSLATIPCLEVLSVSRNKMRGIHTEKLVAGNYSTLIELDFSYNSVQNQHNLICARNFIALKKLYITGNPFATQNQYKGLQMEVYARTGAEVIIENVNPYYLKKQKNIRPPIRFERLVKVANDQNLFKRKNNLFGIELPEEDDLFSSSEQEEEVQSEKEDDQQPMFVTEQITKNKNKKQSRQLEDNQGSSKQISKIDLDFSSPNNLSRNSKIDNRQKEDGSQSMKSSLGSRSIQYGQFHKVAAELLGGQKEYKKGFDIHTSYKALKKAIERANDQPVL